MIPSDYATTCSLLDDDPFANLSTRFDHHFSPPLHVPKSIVARPKSSGHGQVRPANTKPAFAPRPSLPSLHKLAQMNMSLPGGKVLQPYKQLSEPNTSDGQVRKGTPGAHLPHEPWDMDLNAEFHLLIPSKPPLRNPSPPNSDSLQTDSGTCFASREIAASSPLPAADETSCSRSLSGDDADMDSLPSLSYTTSEPSSSALSRSSSVASSACQQRTLDVNSSMDSHDPSTSLHVDHDDEDDPLSYHSDFDYYYTQSFSDQSDPESDLDTSTAGKPGHHSPPPTTQYSSLYDPLVDSEHGSSPDTMRRVSAPHQRLQTTSHGSRNRESPRDGDGWRGQPSVPERQRGRTDDGRQETSRRNGGQSSGPYNGGVRGNDNDRDRAHRGKPSQVSCSPDYSSSSDDDADGQSAYYSLDGVSNDPSSRPHSRTRSRHSKAGGGSDDDVPLAQRVPTALSAQKSIRKQLRDERQQRRLERAKSSRRAVEPPLPPRPTEPLSPSSAAPARFRKRSMSAAPAPVSAFRAAPIEPFPVDDLTKKLLNLQTTSRTPHSTAPLTYDSSAPTNVSHRGPGYSGGLSRSSSRGRHMDHTTYSQPKTPRAPSQDRPLRSMRSFHRPDGRHSETQRSPADQMTAPRLGRSPTATASNRTPRVGRDAPTAAYEQHTKSGRVSEHGRKPSASVPRSSTDRENDVAQRVVQRPPVPPLPISDSTPPQLTSRVPVVQQRIFIGDMQRFNMVEITPATNARDVIETVARQGMLDRSGSWMVFEMAQDYGMERPIRDYELLADVSASWNKDKLLNAFVIKQTPLAQPLSRSGKDEVFLCSLSNFDVYFVTRKHKAPKAFVFAIKSTDHLSLFENAADYLHVFSCNPKDGDNWMQAILLARSYVLYQERNVLFTKSGESLSQAKPLTRSRTRKQSVSARPAQPLVNVPPPFSQAPTANIAFEPGSLLAKRKEVAQL
ncbi:hypothetical protein JVT61DRAFT_1181 [Boletus reticuloceps]|uniref:PH domain-containing protein n=1 Tax=Boletus reticuloceps TaxID=495285 RepID=A0A8I2YS65_9AGAM|nr:hypothetical protein JVT61DRAFT_1181 [Boletus reticuloceps]